MRFDGKVVVVTGGAAGIGAAIVTAFLSEGAIVAALDVAVPKGEQQQHTRLLSLICDVSNEAAVKQAIEKAVAFGGGGGLDILVNNAAAFVYGEVTHVTEADWDRVLSVNVKGAAFCMKHSIPEMKRRGGGAIVNVSSISASCGQAAFVPYSTTKAAIMQMTRNVAMDHGKDNIRANCVSPGPILTEATTKHAVGLGTTLKAVVAELTEHLVIKRMGLPSEVAKAVLFLASDDASFTTGSNLAVDGGYLLC